MTEHKAFDLYCERLFIRCFDQSYSLKVTLFLLAIVLMLSNPFAAISQDAHPSENNDAAVAGTWHMSLHMAHGDSEATLELQQDGSKLSGVLKGHRTMSISGNIVGNHISFTAKHFMMSMTFDGTVDGKTMHGTTSRQGSWSATREGGAGSGSMSFTPAERHRLGYEDTFSMRFALMPAAVAR
jgi:hypothetical protein